MTEQEITILERQIAKYKLLGISLKFNKLRKGKNYIPVLRDITNLRNPDTINGQETDITLDLRQLNNGKIEIGKTIIDNGRLRLNTIIYKNITLTNFNISLQRIEFLDTLVWSTIPSYLSQYNGLSAEAVKIFDNLLLSVSGKYMDMKSTSKSGKFLTILNEWSRSKAISIAYQLQHNEPWNLDKYIQSNLKYKRFEDFRANFVNLEILDIDEYNPYTAKWIREDIRGILTLYLRRSCNGYNTFQILNQSNNNNPVPLNQLNPSIRDNLILVDTDQYEHELIEINKLFEAINIATGHTKSNWFQLKKV
jgi:hypothetical protein